MGLSLFMGHNNEEIHLDSQEGNEGPSNDEPPEQPHEATQCTNVNTDEGAEKTTIKSIPIQGVIKWEKSYVSQQEQRMNKTYGATTLQK